MTTCTSEALKVELSELESLLRNVRGEAKSFLATCESSANLTSKRITKAQKLATAHSAWAKSGTSRTVPGVVGRDREPLQNDGICETKSLDITRAERAVRTRSAAYSIGVRYKNPLENEVSTARPLFYDANDNACSTRKRTRVAHIKGEASRPHSMGELHNENNCNKLDVKNSDAAVRRNNKRSCGNDEGSGEDSSTSSDDDEQHLRKESTKPYLQRNISGRAYSFPKCPRDHSPIGGKVRAGPATAAAEAANADPSTATLDVEKAEKYIRPNVAGPVWKPEIAKPVKEGSQPSDQLKPESSEQRAAGNGGSQADKDLMGSAASSSDENEDLGRKNRRSTKDGKERQLKAEGSLDALSNHVRAPGAIIRPESRKQNPILAVRNKGTPGPGAYAVEKHYALAAQVAAAASAVPAVGSSNTRGDSVAKRARSESPVKPAVASARAQIKAAGMLTPGPGAYDVTRADRVMNFNPPCAVNMGKSGGMGTVAGESTGAAQSESQAKMNSLLEKKKYWEEKARDAREEHDHMKLADDSFLRPRTPAAIIRAPKSSGVDYKNRQIMRERLAEREREAQGRVYDVDYSVIEPQPRVKVSMAAEVASRKSLREKILDKPAIAKIRADKVAAEKARERFYGPNLPVAWGDEDLPGVDSDSKSRSHSRSRERTRRSRSSRTQLDDEPVSDGSGGEESPTEEVMRLLGEKRRTADPENDLISDTAYAYLRSSYAGGARAVQKTAIMRDEPQTISRKQAILAAAGINEEPDDFIGPQLQVDWASELESRAQKHKAPALSMSAALGRDELMVLKKGEMLVRRFAEPIKWKDASLGPGVYDPDAGRRFGEDAPGGVIPFERIVSRQDQVGPYGERPEGAKEEIADILEDELYRGQRLDVDYADAKDRNPKHKLQTFTLYREDRYPQDKDESVDDHIGGTWFEGMADAVQKQPAVVRMEKMSGRVDLEKKNEDNLLDEELAPFGLGGEEKLDLEVKEWNLRMRKAPAVQFKDPKKYPRFDDAEGKEEELSPLNPNFDYLRKKEVGAVIDMAKQLGRDESVGVGGMTREQQMASERQRQAIEGEIGGDVDDNEALVLARDRDAAQARAAELTGKHRRAPAGVDMSRQRGREEKKSTDNADDSDDDPEKHVLRPLPNDWVDIKGGGALWTKARGRNDGNEDVVEMDPLLEREELDLAPNPQADSRFKTVKGGPAWQATADMPRFHTKDDLADEDIIDLLEADQAQGDAPNPVAGAKASRKSKKISMTKDERQLPNEWKDTKDGAADWSKAASSGRGLAAAADAKDIDPILEEEELDLVPDQRASSSYKKVKSGPSWNSTSGIYDTDNRTSASVRGSRGAVGDTMGAILEELGLGDDGLDIDDARVDPGRFQKGRTPIGDAGRSNTGASYATQAGRQDRVEDDRIVRESMASEGLLYESELDTRPDRPAKSGKSKSMDKQQSAGRSAATASASWEKSSPNLRGSDEDVMRAYLQSELGGGEPGPLLLDPTGIGKMKPVPKSPKRQQKAAATTASTVADPTATVSEKGRGAREDEESLRKYQNDDTTDSNHSRREEGSSRTDDASSPRATADEPIRKERAQQRTELPSKSPTVRRGLEDFDANLDADGDDASRRLASYLNDSSDKGTAAEGGGGGSGSRGLSESQRRAKNRVSFSANLEEFSSPLETGTAAAKGKSGSAQAGKRTAGDAGARQVPKPNKGRQAAPPVIRAVSAKRDGKSESTGNGGRGNKVTSTTSTTGAGAATNNREAGRATAAKPTAVDMDDIFALADEPSPPRITVPPPSGTGPPSLSNAKRAAAGTNKAAATTSKANKTSTSDTGKTTNAAREASSPRSGGGRGGRVAESSSLPSAKADSRATSGTSGSGRRGKENTNYDDMSTTQLLDAVDSRLNKISLS